jgi:C-terminal processing protease CtpA/Prc
MQRFRLLASARRALVALAGACALVASAAPLTPEQAAFDVRVLKRALTELHPALTKYRTRSEIDAAFARFEARGRAARDAGEMFLAATEMAAAIRCGHTWTNVRNQGGAARALLLDAPDKLPFTMTLVEGRWLVLASAAPGVTAGDEVLAVNGISARDMVERLWPYLRADGASDGKRLRQLGHDRFDFSPLDTVWPLLSPPGEGRYRVELRAVTAASRSASVTAVTLAKRDAALAAQGVQPMSEDWSLRIDGDIATMTLPTFSFWNSKFDWSKFIDDGFAELNRRQVPNLVIDIRDNEGGDGAIGGKLLSYLLRERFTFTSDQSVTAYERVPYVLARYLDTWDFGFFDRTGQVEKITEGTAAGRYRVTARAGVPQTIEPAAWPYRGRTYMLVGGENSSATFQFALLAQQSRAATLVGQPTGGNLRGLNGGQLAWVTLPNSGVAVDIPLLAASYGMATPDASVTPDIVVTRTFEARRAGRDLEMAAVRREIDKAVAR